MESRFETTIFTLIIVGFTAVVKYGWVNGATRLRLEDAIGFGIAMMLVSFVHNLLKSSTLSDKARRLTFAQRQKITKHLAQYSSLSNKGFHDHILTMSFDEDAEDAELLGTDITAAFKDARWFVDDEYIGPDHHHSEGLWLYGRYAFAGNPPECDLLQDAFKLVGLKLRFDREYKIDGTHLAIGKKSDKCFMDRLLKRKK
jgi:hypothetical protein